VLYYRTLEFRKANDHKKERGQKKSRHRKRSPLRRGTSRRARESREPILPFLVLGRDRGGGGGGGGCDIVIEISARRTLVAALDENEERGREENPVEFAGSYFQVGGSEKKGALSGSSPSIHRQ